MDVLTPGNIKEVRDVPRLIEEWELKCARVKEEHGSEEGLAEGMMVAVLISIIPKELQDMVFQMGRAGEDLPYQEVRDKVVGVAGQREQRRTPQPQVNEVWNGYEWEYVPEDMWSLGTDEDECGGCGGGEIDALGRGLESTVCLRSV
jgi:hypothetical protein